MKGTQITVRKVDPRLHKKIARDAKLASQSINDWALEAFKLKAGISRSPRKKKDSPPSYAKFYGIFRDEDVFDDEFFDDIERIDPEMWK